MVRYVAQRCRNRRSIGTINVPVLVSLVRGIMFAALRVATNPVDGDGIAIADAISDDMLSAYWKMG